MITESQLADIVGMLQSTPSRFNLFNQYLDRVATDLPNGPASRVRNLEAYFRSQTSRPDVFIVAEAPGPWGCRYTGIPITSEEQLVDPEFPVRAEPATKGPATREYSAAIFWRVLLPHFASFLVWNSVPFHPFKPGNVDSIRTPSVAELQEFAPTTGLIYKIVQPRLVLALGRRAEKQLDYLEIPCRYIRHPSQGGARLFTKGMTEVFG